MAQTESGLDKALTDTLKKALQAPADEPYFLALVLKGGTDGKLIVGKRKIPEKQVADAKKETGGSAVVKGVCFGEDGTLVFETAKVPAPAWTPLVKRLAKENAGLATKPVFRLGRDPDQLPDEFPTAPETGDGAAAWPARVDAVTARVKAAAAAKHPKARDMALGLSQAGALFRGGKPADADARLKEVEALLGPAAPPAPPGRDPVAARFAGLSPALKAALAARCGRAD